MAGQQLVSGGTVTLTLLAPGGTSALPDVTAKNQATAANILGQYQLSVSGVTSACSTSFPSGQVSQTSPPPGTLVAPGASVALTVSTGPCPVPVPDVVGETVGQATTTISNAQLSPSANTSCPLGETSTGRVVRQSPLATTMATPGSTVSFWVGCVVGNSTGNSSQGNGNAVHSHGRGHGHSDGVAARLEPAVRVAP
jgi:serine/threonine-protein kinase